jgi:hypothetical protein
MVQEALEILTGTPAGSYRAGAYTEGSVLARAVQQARAYWEKTLRSPDQLTRVAEAEVEPEPEPGPEQPPPNRP